MGAQPHECKSSSTAPGCTRSKCGGHPDRLGCAYVRMATTTTAIVSRGDASTDWTTLIVNMATTSTTRSSFGSAQKSATTSSSCVDDTH